MVDWDLEAGYEYLLNEYEFIDPDRTVALGASYGGYMVPHLTFPLLLQLYVLMADKLDSRTPSRSKIQSPRLVLSISPSQLLSKSQDLRGSFPDYIVTMEYSPH